MHVDPRISDKDSNNICLKTNKQTTSLPLHACRGCTGNKAESTVDNIITLGLQLHQ